MKMIRIQWMKGTTVADKKEKLGIDKALINPVYFGQDPNGTDAIEMRRLWSMEYSDQEGIPAWVALSGLHQAYQIMPSHPDNPKIPLTFDGRFKPAR